MRIQKKLKIRIKLKYNNFNYKKKMMKLEANLNKSGMMILVDYQIQIIVKILKKNHKKNRQIIMKFKILKSLQIFD